MIVGFIPGISFSILDSLVLAPFLHLLLHPVMARMMKKTNDTDCSVNKYLGQTVK